jgi:nitrogen fixation protein FixH
MRKLIGMIVAFGVVVSVSVAGEQTWTGKISDSVCKDTHQAGEHDAKKMTDAECARMCVKKGAKYVFVSDGKVYQLANQHSKTIASHAGEQVKLTGELKGDTITATKIVAPVKSAK